MKDKTLEWAVFIVGIASLMTGIYSDDWRYAIVGVLALMCGLHFKESKKEIKDSEK